MLVNDKINGRSLGHSPAPGPARRRLPLLRGAGILPATRHLAKPKPHGARIHPISNRDWNLLETPVTHTKQTTDSFLIETKLHPFQSQIPPVSTKDTPPLAAHN